MELLLTKDKVWYVIKETPLAPVTQKWIDDDSEARTTIGLFLEDEQMEHFNGCESAKEAWEALEKHHRKSTVLATKILYKKLFRTSLSETGDAEKHVNELLAVANKLSGTDDALTDKLIASVLLSSSPDSYNLLIMGIGGRTSELTIKFVKELVIDEYKRRKSNDNFSSAEASETAMKIHSSKASNDKVCFFCKKPGHIKKNCFKYKAWKKNQGHSSANKVTMCNMVKAHTGLLPKIVDACFEVKHKSNT